MSRWLGQRKKHQNQNTSHIMVTLENDCQTMCNVALKLSGPIMEQIFFTFHFYFISTLKYLMFLISCLNIFYYFPIWMINDRNKTTTLLIETLFWQISLYSTLTNFGCIKVLYWRCFKNALVRKLTWQRCGEMAGVTCNRAVVVAGSISSKVKGLKAGQLGGHR